MTAHVGKRLNMDHQHQSLESIPLGIFSGKVKWLTRFWDVTLFLENQSPKYQKQGFLNRWLYIDGLMYS